MIWEIRSRIHKLNIIKKILDQGRPLSYHIFRRKFPRHAAVLLPVSGGSIKKYGGNGCGEGDGKRETERLERGRSRTEDKIDYRREAGTRTYVGGGEGGEGTKRRDKTDRNTGTIHRAWGGFLFEAPSATLECLANSIKRRHRPYPSHTWQSN